MPLSVWPGARFVPGGHASFFGLLNSFVHIVMYAYYLLAALGPQYQKYIWWKQHMTTLQMIQFIGIMAHGFQVRRNLLLLRGCRMTKGSSCISARLLRRLRLPVAVLLLHRRARSSLLHSLLRVLYRGVL
jgi:hypothetical protein